IRAGEPVTLLAGGQDPPPHCRAAWGAGRPATGRVVLQGPGHKFSAKVFAEKPLPPGSGTARCWPPGSGAAGVYSCKFRKQKYIFVKNEIEKYKNKKTAASSYRGVDVQFGDQLGWAVAPPDGWVVGRFARVGRQLGPASLVHAASGPL